MKRLLLLCPDGGCAGILPRPVGSRLRPPCRGRNSIQWGMPPRRTPASIRSSWTGRRRSSCQPAYPGRRFRCILRFREECRCDGDGKPRLRGAQERRYAGPDCPMRGHGRYDHAACPPGSMQAEKRVTFLGYDNVSTMFLVSDDPVNEGREWVESSEDKSNRAKGQHGSARSGRRIRLRRQADADQRAAAIRPGRGAKRPYQIKLDKKTDLLQTGDSADKAKTLGPAGKFL